MSSAADLLGLEAARGLQVQGCDVTVVHLMPTLMDRQLDSAGGSYLARRIEQMGLRLMLSRKTEALLGQRQGARAAPRLRQ